MTAQKKKEILIGFWAFVVLCHRIVSDFDSFIFSLSG